MTLYEDAKGRIEKPCTLNYEGKNRKAMTLKKKEGKKKGKKPQTDNKVNMRLRNSQKQKTENGT